MSADGSGRAAGSQAPATPREKTAECWAADGRAARTPAGAYPIGEHRIEQLPQPRASARTAPRCTDARLERSLSAESRTAIATHGTGNCGPLRILLSQRVRMVHARQGVRNAPIASCLQSTDSDDVRPAGVSATGNGEWRRRFLVRDAPASVCCKDAPPSPFSTSSAAQTYALAWYLPTATPCRTRLRWSSAGCSASIDSGVVAAVVRPGARPARQYCQRE